MFSLISVAYSNSVPAELTLITLLASLTPNVDNPFNAILSSVLNKGNETVMFSVISSAYSNPLLLLFTFITFPSPPKPFNPFIAIRIGSKNVAWVCSNGNVASILLVITTLLEELSMLIKFLPVIILL